MRNPQELTAIAHAARVYGIVMGMDGPMQGFIPPEMAHDSTLAMDALPGLITQSNSGIPAFLTTFIDPKVIEILVTPNRAARILGENKKGDWTTTTALFPVAESAGEVSSYGDYANNGEVTANVNWPSRQSYHYQTITEWGERQLAMMGVAQIDWASRLNISSARIMDKFQNRSYFYGVSGLQCYGLLNDPNLTAPVSPITKAAGGFTWTVATAPEIFEDIKKLYTQLVTQSGGNIDMQSKMKLCLSPAKEADLAKLSPFNVSVADMLKKTYPNMEIVSAVEYTTQAGEYVQLIVDNVEGQDTGYAAFTEKMRSHGVVKEMSAFKQKKSGGTWGAIITMPLGIASMLGI
jgi:hypothetical protein